MTHPDKEAHGGGEVTTIGKALHYLRKQPKSERFGIWDIRAENGHLVCVRGPDHLDADWIHKKLRKALNSTFKGPDGIEFIATPDTLLRGLHKPREAER